VTFGRTPNPELSWIMAMPWKLALEATGRPDRGGLEKLLPSLKHNDSSIRCFAIELGWIVRRRLPLDAVIPDLLKNAADTPGGGPNRLEGEKELMCWSDLIALELRIQKLIDNFAWRLHALALPQKVLSVEVAQQMPNDETVHLESYTSIEPAAATALAELGRDLNLNGLTSLPVEAASALATIGLDIYLNGLTSLSKEAAWALGEGEDLCLTLYLDGLTSLSAQVAAGLVRGSKDVSLGGLTVLSEDTAKELASKYGYLYLDGLTSLSEEVARALARHRLVLSLNGLTSLSSEAAKALAHHGRDEGALFLDGLASVSESVAKALARYSGDRLYLNGLTTLSETAADELVSYHGELFLKGL